MNSVDLTKKSIFVFDKDDTITSTKSAIGSSMAELLSDLSQDKFVVIISGSAWDILQSQIIDLLPNNINKPHWLFLPSGGSQLYQWQDDQLVKVYDHAIDQSEFTKIKTLTLDALNKLAEADKPEKIYSEQVEYRGGQITLSALGQTAPKDKKVAWDPDRRKRQQMADWLRPQLSEYDVKVGGSTSIDITLHGINKEYGVRQVLQKLDMSPNDAVYFGDSLEPGGNDAIVKNIHNLDVFAVDSEQDTKKVLQSYLSKN